MVFTEDIIAYFYTTCNGNFYELLAILLFCTGVCEFYKVRMGCSGGTGAVTVCSFWSDP